ncbi:MAG: DUF167 family protein [Candidatus Aenigmatarchaeota archaeon]
MKKSGNGILLEVKAGPNSDDFFLQGFNEWTGRLEIKLSEPARDGKANRELVEELNKMTGKEVVLKSGHKSRKKTVLIKDITEEELKEKLGL